MDKSALRRIRHDDFQQVWDLHNKALEGSGAHVENGEWDRDVRDPIATYIDSGGEFLVAYEGVELVLMGAFLPRSSYTVELKRMRVAPNRQGQGLGKILLRVLETNAKNAGFRDMILETTTLQSSAQAFYLSVGYHRTGMGNAHGFDTVMFAKRL